MKKIFVVSKNSCIFAVRKKNIIKKIKLKDYESEITKTDRKSNSGNV